MRHIFSGVVTALCLIPTLASADPASECATYYSNQMDVTVCLIKALDRVNATMERALEALQDYVDDEEVIGGQKTSRQALLASQEAWSTYRREQCNYIRTTFGLGSGREVADLSCRVELGRLRIDELYDSWRR